MKKQLVEFITGTEKLKLFQNKGWNYFVTSHEAEKGILYIYIDRSLNRGNSTNLEFGGKFKFAGVYNKRDGEFYFCTYDLRDLLMDEYNANEFDDVHVKTNIASLVSSKVMELIDNNIKNLEKYTDKSSYPWLESNIEYIREHGCKDHTVERIVAGKTIEDIVVAYNMNPDSISSRAMIEYLIKGEEFILDRAIREIEYNYKQLQYQFEKNEIVKKEMVEILNDIEHPVHFTKRVIEAMQTGNYKTVNVTVTKEDGSTCTFKTEAGCLYYDNTFSYYSSYNIVAKDRSKFYEAFGKHADYRVKEIEKITYGKKVLYTK